MSLTNQQFIHFHNSFYQVNPTLIYSQSPYELANAYVQTFGHSYDYIPYLEKLLKQNNLARILRPSAKNLVTEQLQKITEETRLKAIEEQMRLGLAVNKNLATMSEVDSMSGNDFEKFLGELFTTRGFKAEYTPTTGDQGADLILEKFGERVAVQAKCYTGLVSNSSIQEVIGSKAIYNCKQAIAITNSYFTKSAKILAEANSVELWERDRLEKELRQSYLLN